MTNEKILEVKQLYAWYKTYAGYSKVLNGVDFYVRKGERVGLVGESGCGKTTLMKTILGTTVTEIQGGEIVFDEESILNIGQSALMELRQKKIAMISQEPMSALNPVFTIKQQMDNIIRYSGFLGKDFSKQKCSEIEKKAIEQVMIPDAERILNSYPYQLSGGMRQRMCIASALLTPRELIIADEPGTALDVTIQDQVHRLLRELTTGTKRALIMITHSLGVVRELVDRIYVMYAGNIVEEAQVKDLFTDPKHPYTQGLLECVPRLSGGGLSEGIYGYVPDYVRDNYGCRFYPRCKYATERCKNEKPGNYICGDGHYCSCFRYESNGTKEESTE